uniref:Uncharacterized protein n=1 Tax=Meloidogyne hapla TaxID=6305 RepID=A0A1I8B0P0_MELHA
MSNSPLNLNKIPKQILSINLPNKQKYNTLKPFFIAAFKSGCIHFNIKYNNNGNNQNLKEFIKLINEWSNVEFLNENQVLHRWLIQHGMIILRNCGTINHINIPRQIAISDIEISEDDMNILNDLYKRKAQEQIKR